MGYVPEAVQVAQRPGNYVDISLWGKKRIMKYIRPRSQPPSKLLDKRCEAGEVSMRQTQSDSHTPRGTCRTNGRGPGRGLCALDVGDGRLLPWQAEEFKKRARRLLDTLRVRFPLEGRNHERDSRLHHVNGSRQSPRCPVNKRCLKTARFYLTQEWKN